MKSIFSSGTLPRRSREQFLRRGSVAAIGVFDGVHRGHQKVIGRAVSEARRLGAVSVVVTFHPHPVEVLYPQRFLPYVTTLQRRLQLIEEMGVDVCIVLKFTRAFAAQEPEKFVHDFLADQLGVKKVIIGRDFHFGKARKGTIDLLNFLAVQKGFCVEQVHLLKRMNIYIKTTLIKDLIGAGELGKVRRLLGRRHAFLGKVEPGDRRGRKLGYRTANFQKENVIILPSGIYCVRAVWDKKTRYGLCYIGRRPTFKGKDARVIQELHLLDYRGNLYGKKILVEYIKKLRDDRHFSGEKELVLQIARDVKKARHFFARHTHARTSAA